MTTKAKEWSRVNKRSNLTKKLKNYGGASALSLLITLNACGPKDLDVKKAADEYQDKIEKVEKLNKRLNKENKEMNEIQEEITKTQQEIIDANREVEEAKAKLQQESISL